MTADDRPLLLCYDGSQPARDAIQAAAEVAGGGRAVVLSVWESLDTVVAPVPGMAGMLLGGTERLNEESAGVAKRLAEQGVECADRAGFDAEPVPLRAERGVWRAILRAADEHDARAIVVGSRGHSQLGALLGSVAYRVVHYATCPVLVVPPAAGR